MNKFLLVVLMAFTLIGCESQEWEPVPVEDRIESYEHTLNDGTRCVVLTLGYTDGVGAVCDFDDNDGE